mmetsp:Transcript_22160/g.36504  ORF Transcript_22160/g.36504 Transcript_22160/m.36504 type:complete len:149 (+) Transcript_22160:33-479(+)
MSDFKKKAFACNFLGFNCGEYELPEFPADDGQLVHQTTSDVEERLEEQFKDPGHLLLEHTPTELPQTIRMKIHFIHTIKKRLLITQQYRNVPNREQYIDVYKAVCKELDDYSGKKQGDAQENSNGSVLHKGTTSNETSSDDQQKCLVS